MDFLSKRQISPYDTTREAVLKEVDKIIIKINEIVEAVNFLVEEDDSLRKEDYTA
ncbi:hypothetical protein KAU11_00410 [Candidatus Babeliales bacterium]|nr:hypothetical protein [Candidatus Babeliales bacterium]